MGRQKQLIRRQNQTFKPFEFEFEFIHGLKTCRIIMHTHLLLLTSILLSISSKYLLYVDKLAAEFAFNPHASGCLYRALL
jgi:hypothetical protein